MTKYVKDDIVRLKTDRSDRWLVLEGRAGGGLELYTVKHIRTGAIVDNAILNDQYELESHKIPVIKVPPKVSDRRKITTIVEREGAPTTVHVTIEEIDINAGINSTGWRTVSRQVFKEV